MDIENKTYLGVDWGSKRIGLALGDSETKMATPFKTVGSLNELVALAKEEMVDVIILGKPIKMRGEGEGIAPVFTRFAEELQEHLPEVKIELVDERLSSKAADALPGGKLKASRDEVAAMLLLQGFLDS